MSLIQTGALQVIWCFLTIYLASSFDKLLAFCINELWILPYAVDEALCHPYLAPLHDINEEPVCPRPFNFDFEQPTFTEEDIKELIWRESVKFNPDPPIH